MNYRSYRYLVNNEAYPADEVLGLNEAFEVNDPKFIIRDELANNYKIFPTYAAFKEWFETVPESDRCFHEVIVSGRKQPQRPKFDIDAEPEQIEALPHGDDYEAKCRWLFSHVMMCVRKAFKAAFDIELLQHEFAYSDATDATKYSRHIVVIPYAFADHREAQWFTEVVHELMEPCAKPLIDVGVNKSTQNFRLPLCRKSKNQRYKRILQGDFDDFIVTNPAVEVLPRMVPLAATPEDAAQITDDETKRALELIRPTARGFEFRGHKNSMMLFRRIASSYCSICTREHTSDNTLYAVVKDGSVRIGCFHSKQYRGSAVMEYVGTIGEVEAAKAPRQRRNFGNILARAQKLRDDEVPATFDIEEYNDKHVHEYCFFGDKYDTLLVHSPKGTGKTHQLVEMVRGLPAGINIVFVSFRRTFTAEKYEQFKEFGLQHYRAFKGEIDCSRIIIQYESLSKLKLPQGNTLLIMDEIESIANQTHNPRDMRSSHNWKKFEWLLRNATKVVALDANPGFRSYDLLRLTRDKVLMHVNRFVPAAEDANRSINYTRKAEFELTFMAAAKEAKSKPIAIPTSCKTWGQAMVGQAQKLSDELGLDLVIKCYFGDTDDATKMADLANVNESWGAAHILIYSPTVTAGVDFSKRWFSRMFSYFSNQSVDYKSCDQMEGRIRHLLDREIHRYIEMVPTNLPTSQDDVERYLVAAYAMPAKLTPEQNGLTYDLNENAVVEFDKDLHYVNKVNFLRYRNLSANEFDRRLIALKVKSGELVEGLSGAAAWTDEEIRAQIKGYREARDRLRLKAAEEVAEARVMTDQEYAETKDLEVISGADKASVQQYALGEFYGVTPDVITADFVATYGSQKKKRVFRNLQHLSRYETLGESIGAALRYHQCAGKVNVAEVGDASTSLAQTAVVFAILRKLESGVVEQSHFKSQYVPKVLVQEAIEELVNFTEKNIEFMSQVFDERMDRLKGIRARKPVERMKFLNKLLQFTFDIKLKSFKKDSEMYQFTVPEAFEYSELMKSYRPRM